MPTGEKLLSIKPLYQGDTERVFDETAGHWVNEDVHHSSCDLVDEDEVGGRKMPMAENPDEEGDEHFGERSFKTNSPCLIAERLHRRGLRDEKLSPEVEDMSGEPDDEEIFPTFSEPGRTAFH